MRRLLRLVREYLPRPGPKVKQTAKIVMIIFVLFMAVYLPFFHHLDAHEAGIGWNFVTGETWLTVGTSYNFSSPFMLVSRIDTRPRRVCVTSTTRAVNCRLVQFDLRHFEEFLKTEGFRYYWWSNRLSFNLGYDEEYRGWDDVLRGYGFSAKPYPFIKVTREYQE